jgi:formamidopyrimidine-DNA glycosylase
MPELPEVETTRRGIAPHVRNRRVAAVVVRCSRLRWRVPSALMRELPGCTIRAVRRRAKYLLLDAGEGTVIVHLGMSGSLRVVPAATPPQKHDHVDIVLVGGQALRLRDPRRFGAVLWTRDDPGRHPLLRALGPEPLEKDFSGARLFRATRARRRAVRDFLLDSAQVAGIGNIYANEALFRAGIRPQRKAGRLTRTECDHLVHAIRAILRRAIRAGGTTLRDFRSADGAPGHFQFHLRVYGRAGETCDRCGGRIRGRRLGQRSAFYCASCQA